MEKRRHTEVVASLLPLAGRRLLDLGCGRGGLATWLLRQGADVIGIDVQAEALVVARAEGLKVAAASASALPLPTGAFDAVIIFNSLHHFPELRAALAEARRLLATEGLLYIAEPLAQGPYFTFMQPVDDETEVRAHALDAIADARSLGLTLASTTTYTTDISVPSLDRAVADWLAVDPKRAERIAAARDELTTRFDRHGSVTERGYAFAQPMQAFLLRPDH